MSEKNLFEALGIPPGSTLLDIEQALVANVTARFQGIAEIDDKAAVEAEEQEVRELFHSFFSHANSIVSKTSVASKDPAVEKLKATARGLIADLEPNIIDYALCFIMISRYMALVGDEMKKEAESTGGALSNVAWTSDLDFMIKRYKHRKREIDRENKNLAEGTHVVARAAKDYQIVERELELMAGVDKDALLRSLSSALRLNNKPKLNRAIKTIEAYKRKFSLSGKGIEANKKAAVAAAKRFADEIMGNQEILMNEEEKLYLHPQEVSDKQEANAKEFIKIREYIIKFQVPYMQGKLDSLVRQRDKLLVIGTLDSLMALYMKLIRGLCDPLTDLGVQRDFESQGVENAQYLLSSRFTEVPLIRESGESTLAEFLRTVAEYKQDIKPENTESLKAASS